MKYLVLFDKAEEGTVWAQVPDLQGCFSSGRTIEEAKKNIVEAIELHIEGLREEGKAIPMPETQADFVTIQLKDEDKQYLKKVESFQKYVEQHRFEVTDDYKFDRDEANER